MSGDRNLKAMATLIPLQKRKVTLEVLHAKIAQSKPDELPELVASMLAHITDLHQRISDARYSLMANPSMSSEALFNCCANAHEALEYSADELKQTRAERALESAGE